MLLIQIIICIIYRDAHVLMQCGKMFHVSILFLFEIFLIHMFEHAVRHTSDG